MLNKILKEILDNYINSNNYARNIFLDVNKTRFEIDFKDSEISQQYGLYLIGGRINNNKLKKRKNSIEVFEDLYGKGDAGFLPYIDNVINYEIISNFLPINVDSVELKNYFKVKTDLSNYKNVFSYSLQKRDMDNLYQYYEYNIPSLILNYDINYFHLDLLQNNLDFELYKKRISILNYIGTQCILNMYGMMVDVDIKIKNRLFKNWFNKLKIEYIPYIEYLKVLNTFNSEMIFSINHNIYFNPSIEELKLIFEFYTPYMLMLFSKVHKSVSIELSIYDDNNMRYLYIMRINKKDGLQYISMKSNLMNKIQSNNIEDIYIEEV